MTDPNKNRINDKINDNIKQTVDFVESNPMNLKFAIWISIISGLIISLLMLWAHIDINTFKLDDSSHIGLVLPMNIFMSFFIYTFGFYILRTDQHLTKRILVMILGSLLIAAVFSLLTTLLSKWIYKGPNDSATFSLYAIKDFLVASLAILLTILLFIINRKHRTAMEMEKLQTSKTMLNYEMLQKQLDPHFLFNSLTMLDNLIGHDDAKAKEYLHHLAATFRNSAEGSKPHSLKEELGMLESYKYIMKVRYGDCLQFKEDIDERYLSDYVVYFSLQLLVENVVKHNIISDLHPMTISIESTDHDTVRVSNPLQPKKTVSSQQGAHLGLDNLDKRYRILFGKHINITKTQEQFTVELPLIEPSQAALAIQKLEQLP